MADRANPLQAAYQSVVKTAAKANPDFTTTDQTQLLHIFYTVVIGVTAIIISIGAYISFYLQTNAWQFLTAIGVMSAAALLIIVGFILATKGQLNRAAYILLTAVIIIYGWFPFIWENAHWYTGGGGLLLILFVGNLTLPGRWFVWAAYAAFFSLIWTIAYFWHPFARYDINQLPLLPIFFAVVTGIVLLILFWQGVRILVSGTIRTRLLISFVSITLLPLAIIAIFTNITSRESSETQVLAQLNSIATLKEAEIDAWLESLQNDIAITIIGANMTQSITSLLTPEASATANEIEAATNLRTLFRETINKTQQFEELFLISKEGQILLSTDPLQEGKIVTNELYFQEASSGINYTQSPTFFPSTGRTTIVAVRPLFNTQGRVMGVVAGRANMLRLNTIMFERAGLGRTGETYLIGRNHVLLTASRFNGFPIGASYIRTEAANSVLDKQINGRGIYDSYHGARVLGVYRWIGSLNVGLIAEQTELEALSGNRASARLALVAVITAGILAVVASYLITRSIANPLGVLTNMATEIAAGNLDLSVPVQQQDEIGALGTAFNSMTAQIRELVSTLEQRVFDRTQALATSTEVSRQLSTILNQSELVSEVVNQVQAAFNYYHAHIYLLDEKSQNLIMVAGTGEAGQQMLRNQHMIATGKGLVGRAAATNLPILVPDVSQAAGWLPNPLLPETKAEAAVPIAFGEEVLGVLDVQQNQVNGLQDTDVNLLQSIANQVAVALRNTRLYQELENQARQAALINDINQKILSTTDMQTAMQVAIRELGRVSQAEKVQISLIHETTNGKSHTP